ncbi:lysozyme inhibitor LprI family protein [Celeribacter sp.]|uniref:lysozyme inhibitor LprI family protein n=1 Tax=Celeribacter sp. TaxID=1890673 RepID=UPI003A927388
MRHFLTLLTVLVATSAQAQEIDCADPMTPDEMNHCSYLDYREADEELNFTYEWAMDTAKGLSDAAAQALQAAQRAWGPYRDAACEAEAVLYEGKPLQPLIRNSCMEHLTRQRTADMHGFYQEH